MNPKLTWGLTILLLLAGVAVVAQVQTIPLRAGASQLEVIDQSVDHVRFRVDVAELQALNVTTEAGAFSQLILPGFHNSMTDGAPELPMMNRLLAIPVGARLRIETSGVKTRLIDLAEYGVTAPLLPHQPSVSKSAVPASLPFVYDRAAYDVAKVGQELARVVPVGRLRAMDIGRLEVSPVEYLPGTNQVRVTEEFELDVVFEGADLVAQRDLIARTNSPYFELIYDQVANSLGFHDNYPDLVRDVVTMVIITPPEFEAQLQDFVEWKTRRGFHVVVGVTGTPAVGTTNTSIQTWLHGLYNNATPELPAPSFVLLVGDVQQLPTFLRFGDPTDRLYGSVDSDYMPDMYYGRLSAANSSQLQAILDKTMAYDQFTMPDPSYLAKVVLIGGMEATYGPSWLNGAVNYGTETYFNAAHGITSDTYLYPNSGSQYASIVANASEGRGFIYYNGHGNTVSWWEPTFTQADVNGLAESGKYGLVLGDGCYTGDYDTDVAPECLAETWLRAPNKGAIGYMGACNTLYWNESYYFAVGYRASIVAHPTYSATALGAFDGLFHDHGENMNLWYVTSDALIFCGNLAVTQSGSANSGYYWKIYNLMGDPSLTPYLGVPTTNPVSHPATALATQTSLTVDAAPNSYVGLTQGGVLMGAGTVGVSGTTTIAFLQTPLTPGVPIHLVVTGQGRRPYQADLDVVEPTLVSCSPASIAANTATDVTVTALEKTA